MKTISRKFNVLAIAALLIASASAFTTKTAPAKRSMQLYGRLSTGQWVNIEDTPDRPCIASSNVCKAYFSSQPAQNAIPASSDIVEDGTLQ